MDWQTEGRDRRLRARLEEPPLAFQQSPPGNQAVGLGGLPHPTQSRATGPTRLFYPTQVSLA